MAAWADNGANDICPSGFSVPTESELVADTVSATITDSATAFTSFLRFSVAGWRNYSDGSFKQVGNYGNLCLPI